MQIATPLLFALIPLTTAAALQAPAGGTAQTAAVKQPSYGTASVVLEIDGKAQPIRAFRGTTLRIESSGASDASAKRPGTGARPADVKIELAAVPNESVQAWITDALGNSSAARVVRILEGDATSATGLVHTLGSTTIRSLELSKLDGGSQDLLTWALSLGPEQVRWEAGEGKVPTSKLGTKLKGATSFRLTVDGVDTSYVQKIDPIHVDFGSTAATSRESNTARVAPIHVSFGGNDPSTWLKWLEEGRTKSKGTRTVVLELLDASHKEVAARVTLGGAALTSLSSPNFRGNGDSASGFEAEISCLSFAVLFQPK